MKTKAGDIRAELHSGDFAATWIAPTFVADAQQPASWFTRISRDGGGLAQGYDVVLFGVDGSRRFMRFVGTKAAS